MQGMLWVLKREKLMSLSDGELECFNVSMLFQRLKQITAKKTND
jgi:hypothetical protein